MIHAIIGCSPSSGSSLLRQILNRHSQVFCSPETYLFTHRSLYESWNKNKKLIYENKWPFSKKFDDNYLFLERKINSSNNELNLPKGYIKKCLDTSTSFSDFAHDFFKPAMSKYGKSLVIEKSPANAVCADCFFTSFPNSYFVHIVRNPYDAIASIYRRTKNIYYSVAVNLFHTSFILQHSGHPRLIELKYEHLVENPASVMSELMEMIGLSFEQQQLESGNQHMDESEKLPSWTFSETDKVRKSHISSFDKLNEDDKKLVVTATQVIVNAEKFSTNRRIEDVCDKYGYSVFSGQIDSCYMNKIQSDYERYMKTRKKLKLTVSALDLPSVQSSH